MEFWTFHISVFVNMTNIVVKGYTLLYMCVEVMICQSERSSERLLISKTPSIGGKTDHLVGEKMWRKLSQPLDEFCKTLPVQNRIFLAFQNCGIFELPHVCICQYDKYGSE